MRIVVSIFIRVYLYSLSGSIWFGDSNEYIEVINNIYNEYGFSRYDITEKKLMLCYQI